MITSVVDLSIVPTKLRPKSDSDASVFNGYAGSPTKFAFRRDTRVAYNELGKSASSSAVVAVFA